MKRWEQYQHDAADLLHELGFDAVVNDRVAEPNGTVHFVDIAARRALAGVHLLWIVECKLWNRRVPMEKVAALKAIVDSVGADRGLLMSEQGFQSGAVRMVRQKNIALSSLSDLRANASEDLLSARFAAAENRLMSLSLRVTRDLRPSALQFPRMLVSLAERLRPADVEEFIARPSAIDLIDGLSEIKSRIIDLRPDYDEDYLTHPNQLMLQWRPGIDADIMDGVEARIHYLTQALYQGRLGHWPALAADADRTLKLAWGMRQLIELAETNLEMLERKVTGQENNAAQQPKPLWPHRLPRQ